MRTLPGHASSRLSKTEVLLIVDCRSRVYTCLLLPKHGLLWQRHRQFLERPFTRNIQGQLGCRAAVHRLSNTGQAATAAGVLTASGPSQAGAQEQHGCGIHQITYQAAAGLFECMLIGIS